jgi:hypothetical protein
MHKALGSIPNISLSKSGIGVRKVPVFSNIALGGSKIDGQVYKQLINWRSNPQIQKRRDRPNRTEGNLPKLTLVEHSRRDCCRDGPELFLFHGPTIASPYSDHEKRQG